MAEARALSFPPACIELKKIQGNVVDGTVSEIYDYDMQKYMRKSMRYRYTQHYVFYRFMH